MGRSWEQAHWGWWDGGQGGWRDGRQAGVTHAVRGKRREGSRNKKKEKKKRNSAKFYPVTIIRKNPFGSAQDKTKKEDKKSPRCKIYIYKPGRYICIRIRGRRRRRREIRDEEEQATASHTDTLRRGEGTGFNLCFLVDTTPHLTPVHTHAHTHADTHRQSVPPLSAPVPVLSRTGCVAQLISAEGLAIGASWQGLHRQSGGGECVCVWGGEWEWEGGGTRGEEGRPNTGGEEGGGGDGRPDVLSCTHTHTHTQMCT